MCGYQIEPEKRTASAKESNHACPGIRCGREHADSQDVVDDDTPRLASPNPHPSPRQDRASRLAESVPCERVWSGSDG
jgi:hypothetical protein